MRHVLARRHRLWPRLPLLIFFVMLTTASLPAQWIDTTLQPLRPTYGIGDEEFAIIGQVSKWTGVRGHPEEMLNNKDAWDFAHALGLNIIAQNYDVGDWAQLGRHFMAISHRNAAPLYPDQPYGRDRIIATFRNSLAFQAGFGRELQFYPFDSLQSPYWHWWLDTIQGGT